MSKRHVTQARKMLGRSLSDLEFLINAGAKDLHIKRRDDCRICHARRLVPILKLAPTPIGDEFLEKPRYQGKHPIDLYQCGYCGLAQLVYEISPEAIYRDYLYLTSSSPGLQAHFNAYAKDVASHLGLQPGDLVIDIGSNDGTLLKEFQKLGLRALGIEANEAIAQVAREKGVPTVTSFFKKNLGLQKAKLITANNVVANIDDLDAFMEAVIETLAEDGVFVFESFYLGDVVDNMVFDFIYHEHLSAFSVKPVKKLMQRYGLTVTKTEHLQTKGGSIRYYCERYYCGKGEPVLDDDARLYAAQTYVDFNARIEAQKAASFKFLDDARREGKEIAGFGASISCTTLLYHFGITGHLEYLVDDNPAKIGRYSPGIHLPVFGADVLYERKPDYVFCLAWRFAEDFRRKHPSFNLIVPLPEFRCIPAS